DQASERLAALDDRISSLALTMRPAASRAPAATLAASGLSRPTIAYAAPGRLTHHWEMDDLVVDDTVGAVVHLPIVEDPSAPLWHDRLDANRYWYTPGFEL